MYITLNWGKYLPNIFFGVYQSHLFLNTTVKMLNNMIFVKVRQNETFFLITNVGKISECICHADPNLN